MAAMNIAYNREVGDSSMTSLKAALLHKCDVRHSIPNASAVHK
jgi:hypothetical protein